MLMYFKVTDDKRICFTSETKPLVQNENGEFIEQGEQFDFPEDFDFLEQHNYKIVDGELVYDPAPETEEAPEPTTDEILNAMLGVTV